MTWSAVTTKAPPMAAYASPRPGGSAAGSPVNALYEPEPGVGGPVGGTGGTVAVMRCSFVRPQRPRRDLRRNDPRSADDYARDQFRPNRTPFSGAGRPPHHDVP